MVFVGDAGVQCVCLHVHDRACVRCAFVHINSWYMTCFQGERTLPEKIHPGMFKSLGIDSSEFVGKDMCAGGIQGYRYVLCTIG